MQENRFTVARPCESLNQLLAMPRHVHFEELAGVTCLVPADLFGRALGNQLAAGVGSDLLSVLFYNDRFSNSLKNKLIASKHR